MLGPAYSRRYVTHVTQMLLQILIVTLIGLLVRLLFLEAHSLWLDEAISLESVARNSPAELWAFLRRWDIHPPLYYQILDLWTTFFGTSQAALRAPSVLISTLNIPVCYVAVMQLSRRRTAFVASLILALTPLQVEIGQEARMYALLTLWVCGALVCMVNLLKREAMDTARGFWIGLAVCLAGAAYTHNTGGIFLAAALTFPVVVWLWLGRRGYEFQNFPVLNARGFGFNWATMLGLSALMWIPWAPAFWTQTTRVVGEFWVQPIAPDAAAWTYLRLTGLNWLPGAETQLLGFWVVSVFMLLGVWRMRRAPVPGVLLLGLFLVPAAISLVSEILVPIWHVRSLNWICLPIWITVAIGICGLEPGKDSQPDLENKDSRRWRRYEPVLQVVAILILCVGQISALTVYYRQGEKENWRDAAATVAAQSLAGDTVLLHANWVLLPFAFHYDQTKGPEIVLTAVPEPVFSGEVAEPKLTSADISRFMESIDGKARFFLVLSHDWYTDPASLLVDALAERFDATHEWQFEAIRVFRYVSRD